MTKKVGIFGLGLIGISVAKRLLGAGYEVLGSDPAPAQMALLRELGGVPGTARDVWQADVVFSCVFDTDQLGSLIIGAPKCAAVLISMSTCDPDRMAGLEADAAAKGITLIEAPISGTSKSLAQGDVLLLVAGDPQTAKTLAPLFQAIARSHLHVGAMGNGNRAKLAVNLVLGLNRAALAEGMVFARTLGIEPHTFLSIAKASAAYSAAMDAKGPMMADRAFEPLGRIAQSAKDFDLIRQSAHEAGQGLPFTQTYLAMMQDALDHGEGDLDNAAVLLPIERARPD